MAFTVYVGIDFGTSSTKVAYNALQERLIEPVLFDHDLGCNYYPSWCLPSLANFDRKGRLLLGAEAAAANLEHPELKPLSAIKMVLAGRHAEAFRDADLERHYLDETKNRWKVQKPLPPELLTCLFLVHVLRKVRAYLYRVYADQRNELDLYFWVCMPIHHMKCEPVREVFEKILATVDAVDKHYAGDGGGRLPALEAMADPVWRRFKKAEYDEAHPETRVFFRPESIAQIASYRFSSARRDGLHALIDIGAGTTDVSIFNLRNAKSKREILDCYAWLNVPTGTGRIERQVAGLLRRRNGGPTLDEILDIFNGDGRSSKARDCVRTGVRDIWEKTRPAWGDGAEYAREAANLGLEHWRGEKTQIMLCGGGAGLPYAKEQFSESHLTYQATDPWGPHTVVPLPTPERSYAVDSGVPFARMAVAYGLAYNGIVKFDLEPVRYGYTPPKPGKFGIQDGDHLIPNSKWI